MIGVSSIAWAFPETMLTAQAYGSRVGLTEEQVLAKTGIRRRFLLERDQCELPLARDAFAKLQAQTGFGDGDIDLLVYVTQNPGRSMPHSAAQLLGMLSYQGHPAAFDVSLGCSAFPYVLSLCRGMLEAQNWNRAVIVTNDPYSRLLTLDQPKTAAIFGDAATATLLERDRGGAICVGDFGTDGGEWRALHTPQWRDARRTSHLLDDTPVPEADAHSVRMNGAKLASYFSKRVPESMTKCLASNGVQPSDVDIVVLHQASRPMLELLIERLPFGVNTEVPVLLQDGGNTTSSSIPLALGRIMQERALAGRKVLLTGFGVGLSWGSLLLEF
ncbi:3-oxoacyl-ACP synthase III family protein [Burkholderia lata]|uniref:3-oxoacyl-(Acyl-carrier protein) synthase n=1 Tax=Burkholderia lata (strain ATCC 17760 / DSM 23089 / LMG 22485 / NCIMB 9086 / R18194 / 383) TaxID=482957 RepID=Q39G31_BURL3|nr:3-oxoacyl-[acyl-carrier-protein] synthase III C-terminal domain-containing protein [Burkholderia lata]ABB08585.1 3-oxoacyl-(acyl-carrier protein) synthase [Burkholderia lata]